MRLINNISNNIKNAKQTLSDALLGKQATSNSTVANALTDNTIAEYQDYLRQNGYDENTVNGVTQGLNNGHKEIADWISQYNSGTKKPINIPETDEEIGLAKQGLFNSPQLTGSASVTPRVGGLIPDLGKRI